ncbi:bromodomain-containing protein 4B isoform X4 [Electrophorus electricus]|nr:bromodomain-containing protein 4B isoform X4 [Electrophorus electricus]
MCKVRTEVMEVTRSMLDRRNANFLLWPLCVEVQRCSGCCNSRNMQCVPVTKEMRHLQMTKIQFINRQPIYEKVVIPVEDHVTCSCQSRTAAPAPAPAPRAKATPPPPRVLPKVIPPPSQSKEELHRHDDLKQNQRLHLDDREAQQWQPKYAPSHTQGAPVHTPTRTQSNRPAPFQPLLTYTPAVPAHAGREDTWTQRATPGTLDGHTHRQPEPERAGEHRTHLGSGDSKSELHHHQHHGHHRHNSRFQSDEATPQLPHRNLSHDSSQSGGTVHHHSQSEVVPPHSSQLEGSVLTYTHVEVIGQSSGQSKLPGRHFAQIVTPSIHSSPLEVGSQPHSQSVHAEHQEKSSKLQRHHEEKSDMEREQKQSEHHHHHHHQNQNQTQATGHHQASTHRAVTNAPPTMSPTPQPPPPPTTQRRRRRKHRRRMSKSAMRAMIMVMS